MSNQLGGKYILGNNMSPSLALDSLGKGIKRIRIQKKVTQEDLAKHAGVSLSLIKRLESGKPIATDNLVKVMTSLEVLKSFLDIFAEEKGLTPQQEWEALQKKKKATPKRVRKPKQ